MIVTFCGHSQFIKTQNREDQLLFVLKNIVGDTPAEFFFGGYGAFDDFAYNCCKKYQLTHPNCKLIYVTPYLLRKSDLQCKTTQYDSIIYPEIENVPPKYAIYHRNRWMVMQADFIIAFITHSTGGAYQTYHYAISKNKAIVNLADFSEFEI